VDVVVVYVVLLQTLLRWKPVVQCNCASPSRTFCSLVSTSEFCPCHRVNWKTFAGMCMVTIALIVLILSLGNYSTVLCVTYTVAERPLHCVSCKLAIWVTQELMMLARPLASVHFSKLWSSLLDNPFDGNAKLSWISTCSLFRFSITILS